MKYLFLTFLTLFSIHAQSTKEIIVATESWEDATNRDGTGLYWDIVEAVYTPLGYTIDKKHTSYSKARDLVMANQADMWLAAYKDEKKVRFIRSIILIRMWLWHSTVSRR